MIAAVVIKAAAYVLAQRRRRGLAPCDREGLRCTRDVGFQALVRPVAKLVEELLDVEGAAGDVVVRFRRSGAAA